MYTLFHTNPIRTNPYTMYKGREIHQLSDQDRYAIAQGIADVERAVHGSIGYGQHASLSDILGTVNHHKDVLVGVCYANEEDKIGGPYLGYFMGYEIDPDEGIFEEELDAFTDVTGITYEELLRRIPMGKLFHLEDQARFPTEEAKREFRRMYGEALNYFQSQGFGFIGEARESTTYRLMKSGVYGDMEFLYEHRHPNYFGRGDHMYDLVAYWKKV